MKTGVVDEPFFDQDLVRPALRASDREVRRAVANHGLADHVFDSALRAADVGSKFARRLAADVFVAIAVAGELVAFAGYFAHDRRPGGSDHSQGEERAFGVMLSQERQQTIHALLDPGFEMTSIHSGGAVPEDRGVKVFLDVDAENVRDHEFTCETKAV